MNEPYSQGNFMIAFFYGELASKEMLVHIVTQSPIIEALQAAAC